MARPTLPRPRIRRGNARTPGVVAARPEPRIAELSANGLTWILVDQPTSRGGRARRRALRLPRARRRGRPLEAPAAEDRRVPGLPLRRPPLPVLRQDRPAPERGRARRLHRPGLPDPLPNVELHPVTHLFHRCEEDDALRAELFAKGSGYLLYHVLDDLFDYCFPILDKILHKLDRIEDELYEGRSEEIVRDISNAKQEIIAYRKIIKPERATAAPARALHAALPAPRISSSTSTTWSTRPSGSGTSSTTTRRSSRALESTNESYIAHRQNYRLQLLTVVSVDPAPAHAAREHLRHERRLPGRGERGGVLDHRRRHPRASASACSAASSGSAGSSPWGGTGEARRNSSPRWEAAPSVALVIGLQTRARLRQPREGLGSVGPALVGMARRGRPRDGPPRPARVEPAAQRGSSGSATAERSRSS